jgi:hypothetical protein
MIRLSRVIFVLVLLAAVPAGWAHTDAQRGDSRRFRFMGSGNITMPTAYSGSTVQYVTDDSKSFMLVTQPILGKFLEGSMGKRLSGEGKDKNVFNLKVTCLEEDQYIPQIVWGVSDIQSALGSKIFYFAGSKSIEAFAVKIHGGWFKHPVTTRKQGFFGFEKTVFPLVVLAAERVEDETTVAMKLSPYPGLQVEFGRRYLRSNDQQSIYKLVYTKSF